VTTALEDLLPGVRAQGIDPDGEVTVVASEWHGTAALTLVYRIGGQVRDRVLYRSDEPHLRVGSVDATSPFSGDGALFKLVSEARRIQLAHLFDPMLAVHLSPIEPLPHQIQAVYGELLPRQPLRFLLADDPGAGKTIMAGLYIKELLLRGDLVRCLVVAPGGVVAQWQDELDEKFGLAFEILDNQMVENSRSGNPFEERPLLIARLDHLARREDLQERLAHVDYDLVVADEAHRMAAHWFGREAKETQRYKLGRLLGDRARNLLLMTATPHAGKDEDFQLFLALLDADRFEGRPRDGTRTADTSDLMRRMVKERLLRFDGTPLFPERIASTVPYQLSALERSLYDAVSTYVVDEMNRVDRLAAEGEGRRGNRVGFALTVLQRRLASSPAAIHRSLTRRRERLEAELLEASGGSPAAVPAPVAATRGLLAELDADDDPDRFDDLDDTEIEDVEEELADGASAARTAAELRTEIASLVQLEELARRVRDAGVDRKWQELVTLLDDVPEMRHADGSRRKLIVFTEHRDTLAYLVERLRARFGRADAVVAIHGGTKREERRLIQERFIQDPTCEILVATDAAGEGINLQRAHLLVNYDLPWNPNRIEQRFGRVHRIGQTEVCHMWNLVAEDTREGQVYLTLLRKLDEQRRALGGQVFDVLGEAFRGASLRDLLLQAVRYGDRPDVQARLTQVINERVGDGLADLIAHHAMASEVLGEQDVARIRIQMEEAEARRLQPHYVRSFFIDAFDRLGGELRERRDGHLEVRRVPVVLRERERTRGRARLVERYARITFEREDAREQGDRAAQLIAPGHPLLDTTIEVLLDRHGDLLRQGAVLIDERDHGSQPHVLVYVEHAVADGRMTTAGAPRIVSRRFDFVLLGPDGEVTVTGAAPYLDHRAATDDDHETLRPLLDESWLQLDALAERAQTVAVTDAIPRHLEDVRTVTSERVEKVRREVHGRLTREIHHWDHRAIELTVQLEAGRQPRMNPDRASRRAEELSVRLERRMRELDREADLRALPPTISGASLVAPVGLLRQLIGEPEPPTQHAREVERVERAAVDAVLAAERGLGHTPQEMPRNNPGFDVRSLTRDGHVRFLEVKGRIEGAETVSITRNEILTGLNSPRWILALAEVAADGTTEVRYLHHPFRGQLDDLGFQETSRTFEWAPLWDAGAAPGREGSG
jgi:SNF2 family DNA or RNA helicase